MHSINTAPQPIKATSLVLPLALMHVRAGFPSPAEDHAHEPLDLTNLLVPHPATTFMWFSRGDSMKDAGIFDGDLLLVDRCLRPLHDDVVIAEIDNDFTCKLLYSRNGLVKLVAANPAYPEITFADGQTLNIWGVVTDSIRRHRRRPW